MNNNQAGKSKSVNEDQKAEQQQNTKYATIETSESLYIKKYIWSYFGILTLDSMFIFLCLSFGTIFPECFSNKKGKDTWDRDILLSTILLLSIYTYFFYQNIGWSAITNVVNHITFVTLVLSNLLLMSLFSEANDKKEDNFSVDFVLPIFGIAFILFAPYCELYLLDKYVFEYPWLLPTLSSTLTENITFLKSVFSFL